MHLGDMEEEIQLCEGISADQQSLLYAGQQLLDDVSLEEYCIMRERTIYRLRGGIYFGVSRDLKPTSTSTPSPARRDHVEQRRLVECAEPARAAHGVKVRRAPRHEARPHGRADRARER